MMDSLALITAGLIHRSLFPLSRGRSDTSLSLKTLSDELGPLQYFGFLFQYCIKGTCQAIISLFWGVIYVKGQFCHFFFFFFSSLKVEGMASSQMFQCTDIKKVLLRSPEQQVSFKIRKLYLSQKSIHDLKLLPLVNY